MAVDQTWWPTTAQVAALVNSRTGKSGIGEAEALPGDPVGGSFQDDFSTTSQPTQAKVETLIEAAALVFRGESGHRDPCSQGLKDSAAVHVAFFAARLVEIGYRTDTADDNKKGAVEALKDVWDDSSRAVALTIWNHCPPDPDGPDLPAPGATPRPRGKGRTCPPILGLRTRW